MTISALRPRHFTQAGKVLLAAALGLAPLRSANTEPPPDCQKISFKELAGWHIPDALFKAKPGHVLGFVPRTLRQLDGQEVAVTGFMLPVRIHNRLVTEFLLLRTQNTCCFGIPPELNEVVEVLKVTPPTKVLMDTPITVVGKMHVKERWDGTFLCSIYQMDAERVAEE
ncbi:MAG: DUF3299 domain-containing protein [Holophaga sp.]|jgi:hypothetical protein